MSVNSSMTAIADKIRSLLGLTGTMGLDAMSGHLAAAVGQSDAQADLIAQIKAALEGKAAGGSGGVQLPDLENPGSAEDLTEGKQLIGADGSVITGVGTKLVVKSGTTTSRTIDTGLSNVEQFFIYKESQTATGLIHLHYTKTATSRMYASAWSTQNYGTKTITNATGGVTVSGGSITISATQAAQGALTSGVTYKWIAVGSE